jgi:hypothetical protein
LAHFEAVEETFLTQSVTADEIWAHHFEPETKRHFMEWYNSQSPRKEKLKNSLSVGKVMITVFWDCEGVILVDVVLKEETINSNTYIRTLTEFRKHLK